MDPIQFHDHLTIILEKILCLPAAGPPQGGGGGQGVKYPGPGGKSKDRSFLYRNLLK